MIESLRDHLKLNAGFNGVPAMLCITGASGAGKTTVLGALKEHIPWNLLPSLAFDSLGVPTEDEMIRCWDSGRGWQKAMTYFWVQTARAVYRMRPLVILEGQFDPQYAFAACSAHRMRHRIALLQTDAATRKARLTKRGQPDRRRVRIARRCGETTRDDRVRARYEQLASTTHERWFSQPQPSPSGSDAHCAHCGYCGTRHHEATRHDLPSSQPQRSPSGSAVQL